jgi:DNA-directed RNA polymerase specialized sigma24 family protein
MAQPSTSPLLISRADRKIRYGPITHHNYSDRLLGRLPHLHTPTVEQIDHLPVERRDVAGLAARHPITILDDLLVHPVAPGVSDIVLDRMVTGHPELRAVVVFSDIEGYAYEEIADMLRIPVGTVKSRLHRARRTLQAKLAHLGIVRREVAP